MEALQTQVAGRECKRVNSRKWGSLVSRCQIMGYLMST